MSRKLSLKLIEGEEFIQHRITSQAMLFAELTRQEAKKNSLTQAQIIKESQRKSS